MLEHYSDTIKILTKLRQEINPSVQKIINEDRETIKNLCAKNFADRYGFGDGTINASVLGEKISKKLRAKGYTAEMNIWDLHNCYMLVVYRDGVEMDTAEAVKSVLSDDDLEEFLYLLLGASDE